MNDFTGGGNLKGGTCPLFRIKKSSLSHFGSGTLKTCYHPDSTAGFPISPQRPYGLQPITGQTVLPYRIRFGQETPGPVYQASSTGSHQPPALCGQEHSAFFPSKSLTDAILLKYIGFVKKFHKNRWLFTHVFRIIRLSPEIKTCIFSSLMIYFTK